MSYPIGSIQVTGGIGTTCCTDTFPTNYDFLGYAGARSVDTLANLYLISTQRRQFGMIATVYADGTPANNKTYVLANSANGGVDNNLSNNSNWIVYATSSFIGSGICSLNGLTPITQLLCTGSTGTDFSICSTGCTHTFNIPNASASSRGLLSCADWSCFNSKGSVSSVCVGGANVNITGTNPITTTGTVCVSIPQSVCTTASPTFCTACLSAISSGCAVCATTGGQLTGFTVLNCTGTVTSVCVGGANVNITGTNPITTTGTVCISIPQAVCTTSSPTFCTACLSAIPSGCAVCATTGGQLAPYTGFTLPSLTAGSVLFSNGTTIAQDNSNLFWDATNHRLGIGTTSPAKLLSLGTAGTTAGTLSMAGATSGTQTFAVPSVAGTITWTTPSSTVTNGVWQDNGSGVLTNTNTPTLTGTNFSGTAASLNIGGTAPAGTLTGTTLNSTVVSSSLTSVGTIGTGVWNGTAIADSYISSASTWNGKQSALSGTGFVKISGTTISYDNSTYLTTTTAASTYVPYSGATGTVNLNGQVLTNVGGYSGNNITLAGGNTGTFVINANGSAITPPANGFSIGTGYGVTYLTSHNGSGIAVDLYVDAPIMHTAAISGTSANFTTAGGTPLTLSSSSTLATYLAMINTSTGGVEWDIASVGTSGNFTINQSGVGTPLTIAKSTGAATFASTITATGATLTGALSGTSASFSSNVNIVKNGSGTVGLGAYLNLSDASDNKQALIQLNASQGLDTWFYNGSAWSNVYTLAQNGAATFASSVTISSGNGLYLNNSANSAQSEIYNAGGASIQFKQYGTTTFNFADNGIMSIYATTASTSYTTGALVVSGGVGIAGNINSNGNISAINATFSSLSVAGYTYTSSQTISGGYIIVFGSGGSAGQTLTLPIASSNNQQLFFKNISSNSVTISRAGSDVLYALGTSSSSTTLVLASGGQAAFVSDGGSKWIQQY